MSKITALVALALGAATVSAAPASRIPQNLPLFVDGPIVVDSTDFEGNLLRIPEGKRDEMRLSYDRVVTIVDNMFVARSLAAKARALGLDKDPAVQKRLQQVQEGVLADLYVQKLEREATVGNLEQRARELYKADQSKFMTKEEVHVQHILVNLSGRTREQAAERARQVAAEARGSPDFLVVATRYSDDPDKSRNGGDLGYNSPTSFVEPVRKAIAAMKVKGEIAGPVESEQGFHIVKFIDRKEPKPIPYEAVARKIIEAEQERLRKQRSEAAVNEVRASSTFVFHRDNLEKMVIPIDHAALRRAQQAEKGAAAK